MLTRTLALLLLFTFPLSGQQPQTKVIEPTDVFPYAIHHRTLPNQLQVIVIPTPEFRDMVTFATPVFAGSRQETEEGKTGLAHLFEHIMFRHEFGGQAGGYDDHIRRMGAHNNAWTYYDMTFYHPSTFTENLTGPIQRPDGEVAGLIHLEADRFKNLKLDRKTFEVEAGAVLGEYRNSFANPGRRVVDEMAPHAFPEHTYGHSVIGTLEDVQNMPQAWDAAWEFFRNYYAPNNVALVVVGDVDPAHIFAEVEKHYADWKPRPAPKIPAPAPPAGEKRVHVAWEAEVAPRLMVAHYASPFRPGTKDSAVAQILPELLVSRSAPLFQRLRYEKQTVNNFSLLGGMWNNQFLHAQDAHLIGLDSELILARFRKDGDAYVQEVKSDIIAGLDELKQFSRQPGAQQTLETVRSKFRYDFLNTLNSTGNIAQQFSVYLRFDRDPNIIAALMKALDSLTPADIDAYARKHFTPERRIITTLWQGPAEPAAAPAAAMQSKEGR